MFHEAEIVKLLEVLICREDVPIEEIRRFRHDLKYPNVTAFTFTQQGDPMAALLPIAPGNSPVITITPLPVGVALDPNQPVPQTISSDPVNAPVTVDSTGLIATIAIPASAVVGTQFALKTTYTNADGSVATSSSQVFTIVAAVPPPQDVTGFSFAQTS